MNRRVTFKKLWIVSERDGTGRKIVLPQRVLLLGSNGTGKSRIIKSIFWALGIDPIKWKAGAWDTEVVVGLEFSVGGTEYLALRNKKDLGLFRAGELIFSSRRRSEWDKRMGALFGFHLRLQRHGDRFDQASLEYLLLPSYLDQDGSWGATWHTFANLQQFKRWKPTAFEAYIGERLNAYFEAKYKRDELQVQLGQKRRDFEAHRQAFERVAQALPQDVPTLDPAKFRDELAELGARSAEAYNRQAVARLQLTATISRRERLKSELQLATAAYRELSSDGVYLTELADGPVECPTCGTQHENSFHARLTLSEDVDTMGALVAELRGQVGELDDDVEVLNATLASVGAVLEEIGGKAKERKAALELVELLATHSKKTLDDAFAKVSLEFEGELGALEARDVELKLLLRKYDDPNRRRVVRDFYSHEVGRFSLILNVPADEQVGRVKVGERSQAGGSSAPRSILAVHLALLRTNQEHGDSSLFPFVVDTPQQSGQDEGNLRRMIDVLLPAVGEDNQVILAVEALPEGIDISKYEVIRLEQSHGALRREYFPEAAQRLSAPLRALREALNSLS